MQKITKLSFSLRNHRPAALKSGDFMIRVTFNYLLMSLLSNYLYICCLLLLPKYFTVLPLQFRLMCFECHWSAKNAHYKPEKGMVLFSTRYWGRICMFQQKIQIILHSFNFVSSSCKLDYYRCVFATDVICNAQHCP